LSFLQGTATSGQLLLSSGDMAHLSFAPTNSVNSDRPH
jgi:hypothetical protein